MEALQGHRGEPGGKGVPETADLAADDLLGQLRELFADGAPQAAVLRALETEGFEAHTAQAILQDLQLPRPIPGLAQAEGEDQIACGLDTAPMRRFLRAPGARLLVDDARSAQLVEALTRQGLRAATAAAVVAETTSSQRRFADVHVRRMRRLGLQGMVAGAVFTVFFLISAIRPNYDGRMDTITAAMTAMLTAYSALLYRRHRRVD